MKKIKLFGAILTAFFLLFFFSCTQDEVPNPINEEILQTKSSAITPFKGNYSTLVTVNLPPLPFPPPFPTLTITSTGKATHLGKSIWSTPIVTQSAPDPMTGFFTQDGEMTFTAANGDQLFGSFMGTAIYGPPGDEIFVTGSGTYEITEGSGRFIGAGGSGVYTFQAFEPDLTTFPIQGEGQIEFLGILTNP